MAEVVAEEPDESTEERRRVGRRDRGRVQPGDEASGHRERVGPGGGRLQDRDGIGCQVRPARVAPRAGAFEQGQARQVAERLGGVDGARPGDPVRQASQP